MVTRGQLLERPVILPTPVGCLDGIYLRGGAPGLLIVPSLPQRGGSMSNPVLSELAYAAAYSGAASLRFDYRGVGASEGEQVSGAEEAAEDLGAALDFLLETAGGEDAVVAAYGSGAWAARLRAASDPRVRGLLLICEERAEAPELPGLAELDRQVIVVEAGDDPGLNVAEVAEVVDAAPYARLHLIPGASRHFREGLSKLASLVPALLGRDKPE
jgi:alpha/beta superfamily hydrolase